MNPEQVESYLRQECEEDEELLQAVRRLLSPEDSTEVQPGLALRPGAKLAGRFVIVRYVGRGGMGEVYEATDEELSGTVALKTIRAAHVAAGSSEGRFRREVQLARQVTHSNICRVFDVGHDGEVTFLTMEFLDGETLSARLKREGAMTSEQAWPLLRQMAAGLDALHERGIVHRDFKPGNVMVTRDGRAVITDFGLARAMVGSDKYTRTGAIVGTPAYMAPEQLAGQEATAASDIYAFGVVMMEMRPEWAVTARRCLEREPGARPKTAGEVAALVAERGGVDRRWWVGSVVAALGGVGYWAWPARRAASQGADAVVQARELIEHSYRPGNLVAAIQLLEGQPETAVGKAELAGAYRMRSIETGDANAAEQAEVAARRAIEMDKELAAPHVTMAEIHAKAGRLDMASAEIREALKLDARSAAGYGALAEVQRSQGRLPEAEASLVKAVDLAPEDWRWRRALAAHYRDQGRFEPALEQLRAGIKIAPDNAQLLNSLGIVYGRTGRYSEARQAYEASLKIERRFRTLANLGNIYLLDGDYARAVAMFEESLSLNPGSYLTWASLGSAYIWGQLGKDKADKAYQRAISQAEVERKRSPKDADLLVELSSYYAAVGERGKSEALVRQAVALNPDSNGVAYRAAETYELLGNRAEALRWMHVAINLGYPLDKIRRSPELAELRADKRFVEMEKRKR